MFNRCFGAGLVVLFFYGLAPSLARASSGQADNATTLFVGIGVAWLVSAGLGWARPKLGLLITALMAIGVSLYLGQQHFESGASICDVGSSFSCSDVNKSEYSELFGVPLAYLGASYYGGMLMLAVFALRDPRNQRYFAGGALLFLGGLLTVLLSAGLAYISAVEIGKWCLFCVALYGFNVFATIAAWRWHKSTGVALSALWGKEVPRPNPDSAEGAAETIEISDDSWTPFSWAALAVLFITMLTAPKGDASAEVKVTSSGQVDLAKYLSETVPMELDGSEPMLGSTQAMFQIRICRFYARTVVKLPLS